MSDSKLAQLICRSGCASLDVEMRHMLLQCVLLGQNWGVWMFWRWGDSPGLWPTCRPSYRLRTALFDQSSTDFPARAVLLFLFCFKRQSLFLMQLLSWSSWSSKVSPNKPNFTPMIQNRIPAGAGKNRLNDGLIEAVCTACSTYGYRIISTFTTVPLQYTNVGITCVYVDIRTGTMMTFPDRTWLWSLPAAKPVSLSGLLSFWCIIYL